MGKKRSQTASELANNLNPRQIEEALQASRGEVRERMYETHPSDKNTKLVEFPISIVIIIIIESMFSHTEAAAVVVVRKKRGFVKDSYWGGERSGRVLLGNEYSNDW